jgi:GT2 family glycosyltransferase
MDVPRVSVIVPAHDAARWLDESLESALDQDGVALEVVVVDDGSTDATAAIAARHGGRVRCLRHDAPRGVAAARNTAIAAACGDVLAFLDADDRFLPGKLSHQLAFLDAHPDVGLVHTAWHFIDDAGRRLGTGWSSQEGDVRGALLRGDTVHPVAVAVRRAPVVEAGGFDETIAALEDWQLFIRLALRGMRWGRIPEALCEYRVHTAQRHRRAAIKHATRIDVLERAFADPALPRGLADSKAEAFQRAYLRSTAELLAAGMRAEARAAFVEAVRARPALLGERRTYRFLARLLMPTGRRSQGEAARQWLAVTRTLRWLVEEALRDSSLRSEASRLRWPARWNVLRIGMRLLRKRVGATSHLTTVAKTRQKAAN